MKFHESQVVYLDSKYLPQENGVQVIDRCFEPEDGDINVRTGEKTNQPLYTLVGLDGFWLESCLSEI